MDDFEWTIEEQPSLEWEIIEAVIKPEQTKNVTPTYEEQSVTPDEGFTLGRVNVGAIPPVVLQNKQVTPTKQTQTVTADEGYDGLESVVTEPIPDEYIIPAGKKQINITQNGTTLHDVTEFADAEITVNTLPEKGLVFENYDADGYPHSARFVGAWTEIPVGYFDYYQYTDGSFFDKIENIDIPNGVTTIGAAAFRDMRKLKTISFPQNALAIYISSFNGCNNLQNVEFHADVQFNTGTHQFGACSMLSSVVFKRNVDTIANNTFVSDRNIILYDFSHCTSIPPLFSVNSLDHKSGCVIRIPAALSDTTLGTGNGWESATNWSALTNIVWEVV